MWRPRYPKRASRIAPGCRASALVTHDSGLEGRLNVVAGYPLTGSVPPSRAFSFACDGAHLPLADQDDVDRSHDPSPTPSVPAPQSQSEVMSIGLRNIEEEMEKAVVEMRRAGESQYAEDAPLAPADLCARFSKTCDWKYATGFNLSVVENMMQGASSTTRRGSVKDAPKLCSVFDSSLGKVWGIA